MTTVIRIDAEDISVGLKQVVDLLNIVIDDFEENGGVEARRKMTGSALRVIRDHVGMLADMQDDVVGRMMEVLT